MEFKPARYLYFYLVHSIVLLWVCFAYLFYFRPEILDWSSWIAAFLVIVWSLYNNPFSTKVLGYELVQSYRRICLRQFRPFKIVSVIVLVSLLGWGVPMFKELWSRWSYVEMIKQMTLNEGTEAVPFATAGDLAAAYNLYPHRREVPFILARMGRLLSFDDQTGNYNLLVNEFLKKVDQGRIISKYHERKSIERYEGAIDPIITIARLKVEAQRASADSLCDAIDLLNAYRKDDELAKLYRLIYEHERAEHTTAEQDKGTKERLRNEIKTFIEGVSSQQSPKDHIRLVTSHVFQELLDHYAQLQIEITHEGERPAYSHSKSNMADPAEEVTRLYARILTMRLQIASASDVPWFEGPGKFTIYHYFKHQVGRESSITEDVMELFDKVPGLQAAMKKRISDAEAFKEFRNLDAWDRGTPLSANFAGTGMYKKIVEWLKSGW